MMGIEAIGCEVEVDVGRGGFERSTIVGLPDAAVKESSYRVFTALINGGYAPPHGHTTVNLAPADKKKEGPSFDLPIALGVIARQIPLVVQPRNRQRLRLGQLARLEDVAAVQHSDFAGLALGGMKVALRSKVGRSGRP